MEENEVKKEASIEPQKDHVLPVEQAEKEVNAWLTFKKVSDKRKELYAGSIKTMIEGFCLGKLELDPSSKVITQKLDFGLGKDNHIKELQYQPRLSLGKIGQSLKGVDSSVPDARVGAHIAALTGQVNAVINEMDSEDAVWAEAITVFFL